MANSKIIRSLLSKEESVSASVTPSEYPIGIKIAVTNNAFPGYGSGVVITTKFSSIRCSQVVIDYLGFIYARGTINGGQWSTWKAANMADMGGNFKVTLRGYDRLRWAA